MYGIQSVAVELSLRRQESGVTNVDIAASGDDIWGVAARSATKRLIETLCDPDRTPSRSGMSPITLVAALLLSVGLPVAVVLMVWHQATLPPLPLDERLFGEWRTTDKLYEFDFFTNGNMREYARTPDQVSRYRYHAHSGKLEFIHPSGNVIYGVYEFKDPNTLLMRLGAVGSRPQNIDDEGGGQFDLYTLKLGEKYTLKP